MRQKLKLAIKRIGNELKPSPTSLVCVSSVSVGHRREILVSGFQFYVLTELYKILVRDILSSFKV